MAIQIFVEGPADSKFLTDFILYKYNISLGKDDIIETLGWTNINSEANGEVIRNKMRQSMDNNGINLLIFDADENFEARLSAINAWKSNFELDFNIFLWPNNINSGDLEVMLENIINSKNLPIIDCWDKYEICLRSKKIVGRELPLTTPAKKTKIYGYLEALLGESKSQKEKIKEKNRDYMNKDFWNLDSDYLNPLLRFLNKYFLK